VHEYSIVQSLLERVESEARQHEATAVHRIHLRIGELSGVEIDLLDTAFQTFRSGSICSQAELTIEAVPARWICPRCERSLSAGEILRCPRCEVPAQLTAGDEIFLDRIEMEAT
jgi:hydrogenase nickel incorporation protein HypA/HybF